MRLQFNIDHVQIFFFVINIFASIWKDNVMKVTKYKEKLQRFVTSQYCI